MSIPSNLVYKLRDSGSTPYLLEMKYGNLVIHLQEFYGWVEVFGRALFWFSPYLVGSSKNMTGGLLTNSRAMESRLR